PADAYGPQLDDVEGERRRVEMVAELVRQHTEAERALVVQGLLANSHVGRDRARERVIEAAVEDLELVSSDRSLAREGQRGDRLAHGAIVVDDLRHREATLQQHL